MNDATLESPLKEMRKARNLTQSHVALIADVSQGHLSAVENGITMPCRKLSRVLQAVDLLQPQKKFIRIRQMQTKREFQQYALSGAEPQCEGLPLAEKAEGVEKRST